MDLIDIILSFSALVVLETVLGIDNLVLLSILTEKLPAHERQKARKWGLFFAWITRLLLLATAVYLNKLTNPLIQISGHSFSARDLFLLLGGAFLLWKATDEIHREVIVEPTNSNPENKKASAFNSVVMQVALLDIIFSLDSVLTAIGLTSNFWVMASAITIAILVMIYANGPVSYFISKHPTLKMLALSYLILIGMVLVADSFSFHVPRGYLYFAMGFSLGVESLNLFRSSRRNNNL